MKHLFLLTMALLAPLVWSQSPDVRFRAAKQKETVEGDLQGAIQIYREVADSKGSNRELAAQALLRLGRCYEKLGSIESKKAYEQLLRQYGDETDLASEARRRLAALTPSSAGKGALTTSLLCRIEEHARGEFDMEGIVEDVATDGRTIYRLAQMNPWDQSAANSIVAIDIQSGRSREIYRGRFWPKGLSLSPDGKQLAFSGNEARPSVVANVYIMGVDGSNLRRVFTEESDSWHSVFMGPWSPDGREIALVERRARKPSRISTLSLSKGTLQPWTQISAQQDGVFAGRLSFSPDGQFLAYDVPGAGDRGERSIRIVRRGSAESSVLSVGDGSNKLLGWSPNGPNVLFASDRRGTVDAYRIRVVDGKAIGQASLVRTNIGAVRPLGFRPNGSFYFINDGLTRAVQTAAFDPATGIVSGGQTITTNLVDWQFTPSWSPDGSTLVYANAPNSLRGSLPVLTFRDMATRQDRSIPAATGVTSALPLSAWSSDSAYLYVQRYEKDGDIKTYQVDVRSGQTRFVAPLFCLVPVPGEQALFCFPFADGRSWRRGIDVAKYDLAAKSMTKLQNGVEGSYPFLPSPDGRFLVYIGVGLKYLQLGPVGDGARRRMLVEAAPGEHLRAIAWVGNDKIAYVRERAGKISIWIQDIQTGNAIELKGLDSSRIVTTETLIAPPEDAGAVPLMSFHPNGREVVWVSDEGKNELWALENLR